MPKEHTTAANPATWLHSLLLAAIAVGIAAWVPFSGSESQTYIADRAVNLGILFSMTVGFLMFKSLNRRSDIDNYISQELNKIRRIYHLSRHIAKASPSANAWLKTIRNGIHEYLTLFRTVSFREYEVSNPLFRTITYAIYSLPSELKSYNAQLYEALLTTAGEATEAREFIRAKKDDTVSLFSWFVVAIIALAFAVIIVTATPMDATFRGVAALVIFCLFLVLQLIHEHDRANTRRDKHWARRYVGDLKSLERAEKRQ